MKHPVPLLMLTILTLVFCGGCSSGPSRHDIEAQLNKYQLFAEPLTWYVCLGSVYNDALYEQSSLLTSNEGWSFTQVASGVDAQARQLGLTALIDGGPDTTFINECSQKSGPGIIVCRAVTHPIVSKMMLTDKGRLYLQAPGSIVKDNEAAFVVALFHVLRITEVHREGPDSVVASFEWQQQPRSSLRRVRRSPTTTCWVSTSRTIRRSLRRTSLT